MKFFWGMVSGFILATIIFLIFPSIHQESYVPDTLDTLDRSQIYEVKGSELAKNYANPSFYTDKIFNISLRIDHVATGDGFLAVQYHGGIEDGARVDILLSIEQAKKYNIQKGSIIKFENMVWLENKQMKSNSSFGGGTYTWEVISFIEY